MKGIALLLVMVLALTCASAQAVESEVAFPLISGLALAEIAKLKASDAAADDRFGSPIAISGDTLVAGVSLDDDAGDKSGSAYVFGRHQGGSNKWGQVKKLTADTAADGDDFGDSVAISGDTIVVGAHQHDAVAHDAGSAFVFQRDHGGPNNWGLVKRLNAGDSVINDFFGQSVAISGDTIVVGAIFDEITPGFDEGAAYVFERNAGGPDNWGEVKKLFPDDVSSYDQFGSQMAISGDTIVGGSFRDDDGGSESGSAYVFERDQDGANNWGQVKKLTASDAALGGYFGLHMAISGDTIVVGGPNMTGVASGSGTAYLFERDLGGPNNWGEVKKLAGNDTAAWDDFGASVAISGDTVVVGASYHDGVGFDSGAAYVFMRNQGGADNWGQIANLTARDAAAYDNFGTGAAISGDTVVVGAWWDDDDGPQSGSAYVFVPPFLKVFIAEPEPPSGH